MNVAIPMCNVSLPARPPSTFSRTVTASSTWMIGVHPPTGSLLVRCTTSLAATLTPASPGIHFLYADNGPEIFQQAMKLNQRGLSHLRKKEYDQAIASFRDALQIQPEYPGALDNLGRRWTLLAKMRKRSPTSTKPSKLLRTMPRRMPTGEGPSSTKENMNRQLPRIGRLSSTTRTFPKRRTD